MSKLESVCVSKFESSKSSFCCVYCMGVCVWCSGQRRVKFSHEGVVELNCVRYKL